jgi:probable rRNA maturation factor
VKGKKKQLEIKSEVKNLPAKIKDIKKIIYEIMELLPIKKANISIALVDNTQISKLNKIYLKKNDATDVLSFPYDVRGKEINGEIVVSVERAYKMAKYYHSTPKKELILYIIHGLLHLVGYNDINEKERRKMVRKQSQLLEKVMFKWGKENS